MTDTRSLLNAYNVKMPFVFSSLFMHQWPKRCKSSYRSPVPTRLVLRGCYSTRFYRPRYCGMCTDGRCCTPYKTHTVTVPFSCTGGRLIHQSAMMVRSCVCHYNCPHSSGETSMSAFWGWELFALVNINVNVIPSTFWGGLLPVITGWKITIALCIYDVL